MEHDDEDDEDDDETTLPRLSPEARGIEAQLLANPIPVDPESVERVRQRLVEAGVLPRKAGES